MIIALKFHLHFNITSIYSQFHFFLIKFIWFFFFEMHLILFMVNFANFVNYVLKKKLSICKLIKNLLSKLGQ